MAPSFDTSALQVVNGSSGEGVVHRGLAGQVFLQPVEQAHQLIDAGGDALLFRQRMDTGKPRFIQR